LWGFQIVINKFHYFYNLASYVSLLLTFAGIKEKMNRLIIALFAFFILGSLCSSCRAKKVDCPAYGQEIENSSTKKA